MKAHDKARLEPPSDLTTIELSLTGGMARTDWGINGKPFGEHDPVTVEQGEWYSLSIRNDTTMWHPIHLHGHTPQIGREAGGVRKDTVNILPGATTELVFQATNPGQWMLHCHNAYHLEAGMVTVVRYAND